MIQEAQESLKGIARKTPLENANRLGENIYIKSENLQLTGAFKIRGAYNKIRSLTPEEASHGVIACSAGNHAQGIALSATKLGIKSVICMPEGAPISKVAEAVHELRNDEFAELYADEIKGEGQISGEEFVDECQIESDLELLLPATYVTGSSERMLLYRELDGLTLDKDVDAFRFRLEDRFGPVPPETQELLRIVPLRRLAARLGVEKVFLKGGRMTLFFVSNADSPFYQSQAFGKMIDYMMKYTRRCDLREQNGRRSMLIKDVTNVETAVSVLQEIVALPVKEQDDH